MNIFEFFGFRLPAQGRPPRCSNTLETLRGIGPSLKGSPYGIGGYLREILPSSLKILGAGHYGAVIADATNYTIVYKVFATEEVGYTEFVNYALSNASIHLPIIYSVTVAGPITIVEMERLLPVQLYKGSYTEPSSSFAPDKLKALYHSLYNEKPYNCSFDLHNENYMMRGDVVVVTDPWA